MTFAIAGLVIAILGIPLLKRKVGPNHIYGFRVPETLNDEVIWYETNARGGRDFIFAGIAIAFVSLLVFAARVPENVAALINSGFTLAAVGSVAIIGWRFAKSLESQRRVERERSN